MKTNNRPSADVAMRITGLVLMLIGPALLPATAAETIRTATIGAEKVTLPAPPDACFLDQGMARDKQLLTASQGSIGTTNHLVAAFAACAELADWRNADALLRHHGQFQTMIKMKDRRLDMARETFTKGVCAHETGSQPVGSAPPILKQSAARLDALTSQLAINTQQFLGVIDVDAQACFTGLIQKISTGAGDAGAAKSELAITATTLARGKIVYIYLYAPASGIDGLKALLARAKRLVAAFLKANGG